MGWYFAAGFVSGVIALFVLYWFLDPDNDNSDLLTSEQKRIADWRDK